MKRYKIKIPDMIPREYGRVACEIYGTKECVITHEFVTGEIVTIQLCTLGSQMYDVPRIWLEEVKEVPMTAEEWIEEDKSRGGFPMESGHFLDIRHRVKEAFKAGEENQKKRYAQ